MASTFLPDLEIHISLEGLIDPEKEKIALKKEQEELTKYAKGIESKLKNAAFVEKAPEALVAEQKEKLASTKERLEKIAQKLKSL